MKLPVVALAGPVLVTSRSASRLTVVLMVELLLVLTTSVGAWPETEAVLPMLITVEPGLIWARILTVVVAPAAIGSRARLPLQLLAPAAAGSHAAPTQ